MQTQMAASWKTIIKYVTLIGLFLVGAVVIWTQFVTQDRPATITQVYGTVLVSPANDNGWITARPGQQLYQGDQIFTESQDSGAIVAFNDEHIAFRLEADSLVTMTARWNALTKSGSGGVFMSQGTVKAETQAGAPTNQTQFRVDTEIAQADVQGTRLIVQVLKGGQTTRISALEGQVWVRARPEYALLYQTGSDALKNQETIVSENETVIVYVEPPALESLRASQHLGRVKDHTTGMGVGGVVIQVVGDPGRYAVSDDTGYFEIPGPTLNTELIMVGATSTVTGALDLVTQVGQVKGQVVDIFNAETLHGAEIVPLSYPSLSTRTAADGTFTIEELPVGDHTLIIRADGYVSAVAEVTVGQTGHVTVRQIQLVSFGELFNYLPIIMKNYTQYP